MDLNHALSVNRIDLHAQASTKKRALELVVETCSSPHERADFFHALIEREKLGSTALGHGVALPHARLPHLHTPIACFLKLDTPVHYDAPDNQPVDLIIGLFVSEAAHDTHLQLLSQIAQTLSQEFTRIALRQCKDAREALLLITQPLGDISLVS
jgi:PTS system nitrogen regulatory IIA component